MLLPLMGQLLPPGPPPPEPLRPLMEQLLVNLQSQAETLRELLLLQRETLLSLQPDPSVEISRAIGLPAPPR